MTKTEKIQDLYKDWDKCTKCPLKDTRTQVVRGHGSPDAKLVFIGEAPGKDEDIQGIPFVGQAGEMFNKILESVGLKREDLWITNTCLCRPKVNMEGRKNRAPTAKEIKACKPRLQKELVIVQPRLIILGGNTPLYMATGARGITKKRGWIVRPSRNGVGIYATLHPASLLYGSPDQIKQKKKWVWEDWKEIAIAYEEIERKSKEKT